MDKIALEEQLEIIRRIAERGLGAAHDSESPHHSFHNSAIDLFQHILDEIEVAKLFLEW